MGNGSRTMVVAVLVILLLSQGPASVLTVLVPALGDGPSVDQVKVSGRAPRDYNDNITNTTGGTKYYASLVSIAGLGTFTERANELEVLDMDGDGHFEVASATEQGFVEVLAPPDYDLAWRSLEFPGGARAISSGDLNDDGRDELVVGDLYGTVYVFDESVLSDPNSQPVVTAALDRYYDVTSLGLIDLDEDGRTDILVYTAQYMDFTFLRNIEIDPSGNGTVPQNRLNLTLENNRTFYFQEHIRNIEIADTDGDGMDDILGLTYNVDEDGLYLFHINRTLEDCDHWIQTDYVRNIQVIDIDMDSEPEILVNGEFYIQVLNGADLQQEWYIGAGPDEYIRGMQGGDFDLDGTPEIVSIEFDSWDGIWNLSKINVTTRSYEWRDNFTRMTPQVVASRDVDGDGRLELLMTNTLGLTVMTLEPDNGNNHTIEVESNVLGYDTFGIDAIDHDGDGKKELAVGSKEGYVSIVNMTTGHIEAQAPKEDINVASIVAADLDKDGLEEIVAGNGRKVIIYDKDLGLINRTIIDDTSSGGTLSTKNTIAVSDLDQDDRPEIIVGTDYPRIHVLTGHNRTEEFHKRGNSDGKIKALVVQDLDGDGQDDLVTGDSLGYVISYKGPQLENLNKSFHGYGPFGMDVGDVDHDGVQEVVVGDGYGRVTVYNGTTLEIKYKSNDLGNEIWGIKVLDLDGDGRNEILFGQAEGYLAALNGTTLGIEWRTDLGNWLGAYNSLVVEDLDDDGHLEIASGSDGYVYVLRLLLQSEKPDVALEDIVFQGLPGTDTFEDGDEIEVAVDVLVKDRTMDLTFEFSVEPVDVNLTGRTVFATVEVELDPGSYKVSANWTSTIGSWLISVMADANSRYSEVDEDNNLMELEMKVVESYAQVEMVIGQGTDIGRYGSMVLDDDDADGVPELIAANTEGFVQSYHVTAGKGTGGSAQVKEMVSTSVTPDVGTNPYGLLVMDVDMDGEKEVVTSDAHGYVHVFMGVGKKLEWKTRVSEYACYGLEGNDIDMDGHMDILVGCSDSKLYIINGTSGMTTTETTLLFELWAIEIGDVHNDGHSDIVIGTQNGTVYILDPMTLSITGEFKVGDLSIDELIVADIDLDGRTETVFGDRSGYVHSVEWTYYEYGQFWYPVIDHEFMTGSSVKGIELVDLVPEPGPEVVVGSEDSITVLNGTLAKIAGMAMEGKLSGIVAGDVDRDGSNEVIVGTVRGDLQVLGLRTVEGEGTEVLVTQASLVGIGPGFYGTTAGDLDGDMGPEIALGTGSGELLVIDGVTKEIRTNRTGMGTNLYGLDMADVDGDGQVEILKGSGEEMVCALDGKDLSEEWCAGKFGDWAIAVGAEDMDGDGTTEVVVGSGGMLYLLDGSTGTILNSTYDLGDRILGIAIGNLDNDTALEVVTGTIDGVLHIFDGRNLTKEWGVLLDSWPVGMAIADMDGDGIGTVFVGTQMMVYEVSLQDKEVLWEYEMVDGAWGIEVADFDGDTQQEILVGTREGRVVAFKGPSRHVRWSSKSLGSRAGWYNSLEVKDIDWDGQMELLVGSSGYFYVFGSGAVDPDPLPDALVEDVGLPEEEIVHGTMIDVSAKIYNHGLAPMRNLTVHLLMDGTYHDSTLISYMAPLEAIEVPLKLEVEGGEHEISIVVDRYDAIQEYNEGNNNQTIVLNALLQKNLAVIGGTEGIYFSSPPVKDIQVTIFAIINNTGDELAEGTVMFYWANLKPIGEDTVSIRGGQEVMAAVNWSPPEAGSWDITVVVIPSGGDSDDSDNIGTRKVQVLTHPSVTVHKVHLPDVIIEDQEHLVPVDVVNNGEAPSEGLLVLYLDEEELWRSTMMSFAPGRTEVVTRLTAEAGPHNLIFLLENVTYDDHEGDDWIETNVTVVTRPDLTFGTISQPEEGMLRPGRELVLGAVVENQGGANASAVLKVFDNGRILHLQDVTVPAGGAVTVPVPWIPGTGNHELVFLIEDVDPWERKDDNNKATVFLDVPKKEVEKGPSWPLIALLFIVFFTPMIALIFYYSQVQPIRDMAAIKARAVAGPVKGGPKGRMTGKGKKGKAPGKVTVPKRLKKVEEEKDKGEEGPAEEE